MGKEGQSILVVGGGGREHALLWKLAQSPQVGKMYCAPGNAGTAQLGENLPIAADDIDKLLAAAKDNHIDFTVVGPEAPLAKGIVNDFNEAGKIIFGPTQEAAQLETSKIWAIKFMQENGIPHFQSYIPDNNDHARHLLETLNYQDIVIKEDGLAQGKGVYIPETRDEALQTVENLIQQDKRFFYQQRGYGQEVSLLAVSDGKNIQLFPPVKDHKRLSDGDIGPNTGGMGAYSFYPPDEMLHDCDWRNVRSGIIKQTIDGMYEKGIPFKGILYAGLMLAKDGPRVLEYNVRFGDPETQVLMMLMRQKNDLFPILYGAATGDIRDKFIAPKAGAAMTIVYAAEGYPKDPKTGDVIFGLDAKTNSDLQIFQSGTLKNEKGETITNGGRVVSPTAFGKTLEEAREKIDSLGIYFRGMQRRHDIGKAVI